MIIITDLRRKMKILQLVNKFKKSETKKKFNMDDAHQEL